MFRSITRSFLIVAALAGMSLPVLAKTHANTKLQGTLDVTSTTKLGSTTLAPGEYNIAVEGNQVKFEQNGKVVAEAPCTLQTLANKAPETELVTDNDHVTEIQISGKTEAIDVSTT